VNPFVLQDPISSRRRAVSATRLKVLGLPTTRFKTGTPGRFHFRSLDTDVMELQHADAVPRPFSFDNEYDPTWRPLAEKPCYITWTTAGTKKLIEENLDRSPLYSGVITGIGPRYCPSIEDKMG